MNRFKIIGIIYATGIIIVSLFFDVWGAETTLIKKMSVFICTIVFIVVVFFVDKNEKKKLIKYFILIFLTLFNFTQVNSEIIILSSCDDNKVSFLKNEYILDLKKSLMIRNFVYNDKTFKKLRITDLSVKKKNTTTKFIYKEDNKILTDKIGYPQFYTQLVFELENSNIMIKTVINEEVGISLMSECKKIERYEKES